ncbi:MAG: TonB-dependent receptor, partial [Muribaculaceae bacterium]|nr:TonB-dependent receptor [Muribaculaceae bacterium]
MKTSLLLTSTLMLASSSPLFAQEVEPDSIVGSYYDLEDLVVVADKPIVQTDGAKLTYNLEEDPSAKGNTLLDALRKVPMVSVDGEDKIRINGQDNFKIYVNGKEDPSLSANYKQIFKAMPADAVVKIEVITEPGAKYDAEGTAGILNLVTLTKNSTDGYSGSVEASFSKMQTGGSVYGRMKKGKLSMSANVNYANSTLFPQHTDNTPTSINYESTDARYQTNTLKQRVKYDYAGGGINLSYDLTDNDLITLNGNVYTMHAFLKDNKSIFSSSTYNDKHVLTGKMSRYVDADLVNTGVTAGTSWQHNFNADGHKTILSYLYNHGYNKLAADFTMFESYGNILTDPFKRMDNRGFNNEHTLQFDYINPLGSDRFLLESGAKAVWRRNDANSYELIGKDEASAVESPDDRSDLTQIQDIYAAYASLTGNFNSLSFNAGMRYEHTRMGIDFHAGDNPDFINHLNDLVPNAAISYMFSPASNLRLTYQMRISRPSLNQINPFRQSYIPNYVETGNPDLSSERANKISLTYSNFGRVLGGNIGLEYSTIDNAIAHKYLMEGDTFCETYANIGHNRSLAFFGFLNWTIIPRMQFSVNTRLTRQMFSSPEENLSNAGWNLN